MDEDEDMTESSQDDLSKRRELRQKYHQKKMEIQEQREELTSNLSQLNIKLAEVDELFAEVKTTREAALDSCVIRMVSSIGTQKAKDFRIQLKCFEPVEFAEKVVTFMKGGARSANVVPPHGWSKMGAEAMHFFSKPPTFHYMVGSFERGEIPRKERNVKKREKEVATKSISPEEIRDANKEKPDQTTEEVERILRFLQYYCGEKDNKACKKYTPICYFEFVINPHSFGLTIENIFHVSFLVKDGYAKIGLDADKLPTIEPVVKKSEGASSMQKNEQFIMSLNMEEWEEIKRVFQITAPLIHPRVRKGVQPIKK